MWKKLKLWWFQRRARKLYFRYHILREKYDCGNSMFQCISTQGYNVARKFNRTMDKLKELDPLNAPKLRL